MTKFEPDNGDMTIHGLPPLVDNLSKILLLGTLPGTMSIANQEYYADPSNNFWKLLGDAMGNANLKDYPYTEKCSYVLQKGIAIWDILKSANRLGAMDNGFIHGTESFNNLTVFLRRYPFIEKVVLLGTTAKKYYRKGIKSDCVPSSMPFSVVQSASATPGKYVLPIDEKCEQWKKEILC